MKCATAASHVRNVDKESIVARRRLAGHVNQYDPYSRLVKNSPLSSGNRRAASIDRWKQSEDLLRNPTLTTAEPDFAVFVSQLCDTAIRSL